MLSKEDREEVVSIIDSILRTCNGVSSEAHNDHHDFIQEIIQERRDKKQRWAAIKTQTISWAIISILAGIGAYVANLLHLEIGE